MLLPICVKRTTQKPAGVKVLVVLKDKADRAMMYDFNEVFVTDIGQVDEFDVGQQLKESTFRKWAKNTKDDPEVPQQLTTSQPGTDWPGPPIDEEDDGSVFSGSFGVWSKGEVYEINASEVDTDVSPMRVPRMRPPVHTRRYVTDQPKVTLLFPKDTPGIKFGATTMALGTEVKMIRIVMVPESVFTLGHPSDFTQTLMKTAGMESLEVFCEGSMASVKVDDAYSGINSSEREFRRLVIDVGLMPGSARHVLKQAEEGEDHKERFLIKRAEERRPMWADPHIMTATETRPEINVISGAREYGVLLQDSRRAVQRASESGSQDLFDIQAMKGLFDVVSSDIISKETLLQWIRAMDECGRTIVRMAWQWDDMIDQYGSEDSDRLMEAIKTNFKELGSLILRAQENFTDLHGPLENSMDGMLAEEVGDGA